MSRDKDEDDDRSTGGDGSDVASGERDAQTRQAPTCPLHGESIMLCGGPHPKK